VKHDRDKVDLEHSGALLEKMNAVYFPTKILDTVRDKLFIL